METALQHAAVGAARGSPSPRLRAAPAVGLRFALATFLRDTDFGKNVRDWSVSATPRLRSCRRGWRLRAHARVVWTRA